MRKVKVFLDIEKEVQWLNEMSSNGYRLVGKDFGDYRFEKCTPNQFVYDVQRSLFKEKAKEKEYATFLEEVGINIVKCNLGWWYLEKVNDGKSFELFTDAESKISHYERLVKRLVLLSVVSWILVIQNIQDPNGPWLLKMESPIIANISFPLVVNLIILVLVYNMVWKYWERMKSLRQEEAVQEN